MPVTWWACPLWKPCAPPAPGDLVGLALGLVWAILLWFWIAAAFRLWMRGRDGRV